MALPKKPVFETMNVTEARRQFSETLNRVHRGEARVVVEKSGIPVGVLVSPQDAEELKILDEKSERALNALEAMQAAFADVPEEEFDRELEKAMAETKEIQREGRTQRDKKSA